MSQSTLTPFWIVPPSKHGPLGFGVTAFSLADALRIIEDAGYELPKDRSALRVTEGIRVDDLDESHVVRNMGPIVVRGIWYPFTRIGA
jgi:hypothetical protein